MALTVPLLFAVACSSGSSSRSSTSEPAPDATTSIPVPTTETDLEVEFVRALTSQSVEGVERAAAMAVPGSPAALYVDFERLRDDVRREAGEALAADLVQRQDDRVVMSSPLVEMYRAFTDFAYEGDLIHSFAVATVPIDGLVVGPGTTATVGGDTYQIAGARISSLGTFAVVVEVTGGSPGTVLPTDATLNTTDGPQASELTGSVPITQSAPGTSVLAYYEFFRPVDIVSVGLHVCTQGTNVCEDITLEFLATQTA